MTSTLTGGIYKINPPQRYKDFHSQSIWLKELDVKYPSFFEIQFWHDDGVEMLKFFREAEVVEVQVEIRGKIWTNRNTNKESVINILKGTSIKKI
jgi:single-stranded DNA-binding protein